MNISKYIKVIPIQRRHNTNKYAKTKQEWMLILLFFLYLNKNARARRWIFKRLLFMIKFWAIMLDPSWSQIRPEHSTYTVYHWITERKWSCPVGSNSATPWTVACQAPLSMEFSRQEYWSGLPFPSLGDLPDPGIEPESPALQKDSLLSEPPGKPHKSMFLL